MSQDVRPLTGALAPLSLGEAALVASAAGDDADAAAAAAAAALSPTMREHREQQQQRRQQLEQQQQQLQQQDGGIGGGAGALDRTGSDASSSARGGSPAPSGCSLRLRRQEQAFVIGVAGGTASGKTTVCSRIMHRLHDSCAVIVHQDSFYRALTPEERADVANYNFDAPGAFDSGALLDCILKLKVCVCRRAVVCCVCVCGRARRSACGNERGPRDRSGGSRRRLASQPPAALPADLCTPPRPPNSNVPPIDRSTIARQHHHHANEAKRKQTKQQHHRPASPSRCRSTTLSRTRAAPTRCARSRRPTS